MEGHIAHFTPRIVNIVHKLFVFFRLAQHAHQTFVVLAQLANFQLKRGRCLAQLPQVQLLDFVIFRLHLQEGLLHACLQNLHLIFESDTLFAIRLIRALQSVHAFLFELELHSQFVVVFQEELLSRRPILILPIHGR